MKLASNLVYRMVLTGAGWIRRFSRPPRRRTAVSNSTMKRTGRSWAVDVATRHVVGRRTTFSPWSGFSISIDTGVFASAFPRLNEEHRLNDERSTVLVEDEVTVAHRSRKDRTIRAVVTRIAPTSGVDGVVASGAGDGKVQAQAQAQAYVLFASVDCPVFPDRPPVDVTAMLNARLATRSFGTDATILTSELLAVMSAISGDVALSAFAADARSRLLVVMPDLREIVFEQGEPVVVEGDRS